MNATQENSADPGRAHRVPWVKIMKARSEDRATGAENEDAWNERDEEPAKSRAGRGPSTCWEPHCQRREYSKYEFPAQRNLLPAVLSLRLIDKRSERRLQGFHVIPPHPAPAPSSPAADCPVLLDCSLIVCCFWRGLLHNKLRH